MRIYTGLFLFACYEIHLIDNVALKQTIYRLFVISDSMQKMYLSFIEWADISVDHPLAL